jgi:hypothetical protein
MVTYRHSANRLDAYLRPSHRGDKNPWAMSPSWCPSAQFGDEVEVALPD